MSGGDLRGRLPDQGVVPAWQRQSRQRAGRWGNELVQREQNIRLTQFFDLTYVMRIYLSKVNDNLWMVLSEFLLILREFLDMFCPSGQGTGIYL